MQDWRIQAYDEMIERAKWLISNKDSYEILPYYRGWVSNTAQRIKLFPQGEFFARQFENHIEHIALMRELELNNRATFTISIEKWLQFLLINRPKLIDLLNSHSSDNENIKYNPSNYHLFISYASEDKEPFVERLVHKLTWLHLKVWYDNTELLVGDSIRRGIDNGISHSRYGVVVFSPNYLSKKWTQYELDGIVAREGIDFKVLLPILYNITSDEIKILSPTLSQRVALDSAKLSTEEIAYRIAEIISKK